MNINLNKDINILNKIIDRVHYSIVNSNNNNEDFTETLSFLKDMLEEKKDILEIIYLTNQIKNNYKK